MEGVSMLSEKDKRLLVVNNFKFCVANTLQNGTVRWRCVNKKSKCPAKLYTSAENFAEVIQSELNHNHSVDITLPRQILSNSLKRKALESPNERPAKLLHTTLNAHPAIAGDMSKHDIELLRHNIWQSRQDRSSKRKKTVPSDNLLASEKDASQLKVVALSRRLPDTIDPCPEASTKTYTWVKNDVTGPEADATKGIKIFQGNSEIPIVKVVAPYAKDINKPAIPITLKPILPRPVNFDGNCPVNFDGNSPINFDGNLLQNILRTSSTQHDDTSNNCEQFSDSETKRQKIENIETDESASNFNYNFHSQNTNVLNEKEQPEKELYKERRKVILLQKEVSRLKTLVFKLQKIISDKL